MQRLQQAPASEALSRPGGLFRFENHTGAGGLGGLLAAVGGCWRTDTTRVTLTLFFSGSALLVVWLERRARLTID